LSFKVQKISEFCFAVAFLFVVERIIARTRAGKYKNLSKYIAYKNIL